MEAGGDLSVYADVGIPPSVHAGENSDTRQGVLRHITGACADRPVVTRPTDWHHTDRSLAMQHRPSGFTLIELMISVAIVGILAGVAIPSLTRLIEHQRTASATASLHAHMALARMTAVTRNQRTVLCPSSDGKACAPGTDWSTGWMLFSDEDGNKQPDAMDDILRIDLEPTSRHLRINSTAGRQQLRYLPDGRSAGTNLTLSICSKDGTLLGQVIVNNVGRPRSQKPRVPTACPA